MIILNPDHHDEVETSQLHPDTQYTFKSGLKKYLNLKKNNSILSNIIYNKKDWQNITFSFKICLE